MDPRWINTPFGRRPFPVENGMYVSCDACDETKKLDGKKIEDVGFAFI